MAAMFRNSALSMLLNRYHTSNCLHGKGYHIQLNQKVIFQQSTITDNQTRYDT